MKIPYSEGTKTTVYISEKIKEESVVLMVLVSGKQKYESIRKFPLQSMFYS